MKKPLLLILALSLSGILFGQESTQLQLDLLKSRKDNEAKLDQYLKRNASRSSTLNIEELKSNLAGFAGEIPLFWQSDDTRANSSANVIPLQSGSLTGLNNTAITGNGIDILVMDGGKVFESHNEFGGTANGANRVFDMEGGTTSYSGHATNVASIIAAAGVGNYVEPYGSGAIRGVLPQSKIYSYSFATTNAGTNYQKLQASNANISNHSYGINLGWNKISTASGAYPTAGFYWIANYELNTKDTYSGSYYTQDENFDKIVYSNPNQIVVKSSGNYYGTHPNDDPSLPKFKYDNATNKYVLFGNNDVIPDPNCSLGYNCIGWGSLAKNIIVVGATEHLQTTDYQYTTSGDVGKAGYSSAGPRKDGGIKPDISAVGSDMIVANYSSPTNYSSAAAGSGTSYAAPMISGIAGALTQVNRTLTSNNNFTFKADEMKALLTHTANEAGRPGPDVWYGWGFADATKGAQLLIDKKNFSAYFERNALTSGVKFTKTITAKNGEPLKATISWVDPAAVPFEDDVDMQSNTTTRIINDLDLRIIDTTDNTVYFPWKLDVANPAANALKGDNTADNVEQVLIPSPVSGRIYRIEVSNKGTLVNDSNVGTTQNYALIITGIQTNSLSTSDLKEKNQITVYPTQTKDFVNILIPKGAKSIAVFDASGKSVVNTAAKSFQTIDLSRLPKGVYLIQIKTETDTVVKKVIKE